MNKSNNAQQYESEWFAIRTRQDKRAEIELAESCDEVLYPKETVKTANKITRTRAVMPHVMFIKTTRDNALTLEKEGREHPEWSVPFWIYRYPMDNKIQTISATSIELLRLLTAGDTTKCEIFKKQDFKANQHVRVTGGPFEGYQGYVQRVKKDKHVIVKIEGVCLVMLPFIHPDLLEPIPEE